MPCGSRIAHSLTRGERLQGSPIRIVVPFVPGGSSDIVARSVAAKMQLAIGQSVVVENRPGANGAVAAEQVMRSPADGYTFMVGSSDHLSAELFKLRTSTFGVHVPYRGGAAAMADLMGGNVDASFQNLGAAVPHIRSGRLKAIAVTSKLRVAVLPDVPTVIEGGLPGFVVTSWQAFMAPRGLPPDVRNKLHTELVAALNSSELKDRFALQGFDVVANKPEELAEFQRKEIEMWRDVVKQKGLTPD